MNFWIHGSTVFRLQSKFQLIGNKFWFSHEQEAEVYCYIHFGCTPEMLTHLVSKTFWGHEHLLFTCLRWRPCFLPPLISLLPSHFCPWEKTPMYVTICFLASKQSTKSYHSKVVPQSLLTKASSTIPIFKINTFCKCQSSVSIFQCVTLNNITGH